MVRPPRTTSRRVCPACRSCSRPAPRRARRPIAEAAGRITIEETDRRRKVILTPDNGDEPHVYPVLKRSTLLVEDGQHVELGQQLIVGTVDPKEVLRVKGVREVQKHLVGGVQGVYRSQGVPIHDKHIEVIVRQMLRKVTVVDHGDTDLLPGELVDRSKYNEINRATLTEGKKTASARQEVMGITKASLATESWLSAASFQETTRVLTQAAMEGKSDPLIGLKENVIIGKLIPAGTGLPKLPQRHGRGDRGGQGGAVPQPHLRRRLRVQRDRPELRRLRQLQLGRLHPRHLQLRGARATKAPACRGPSSLCRLCQRVNTS